jgi:hypothetical protein
MFKVYSGPPGSEPPSPLERQHCLFKQCSTLGEAMDWAGHLRRTGRVALLIEGDDGTHLSRSQIAASLPAPTNVTPKPMH